MQRKESRKILFVLTDGVVNSKANDDVGVEELRRFVIEAKKVGQVEIIAIDLYSGSAARCYDDVINVEHDGDLATKLLEGIKDKLKL